MPERIRFERELDDLGLREYEEFKPFSKNEIAVGEQVELNIGNTVYANLKPKVLWKIPGIAIRGFDGNTKTATVFPLTKSALESTRIVFCWVDPGDGKQVRVQLTYNVGGKETTTEFIFATFDVKAPKVDFFDAKTTKPSLITKGRAAELRFAVMRKVKVKVGNKEVEKEEKVPGIQWNWKVTLPANHPGLIKDLQTVRLGRTKTQKVSGGSPRKLVYRHANKISPLIDQDPREGQRGNQPQEATYSSPGFFGIEFPVRVEGGKSLINNETWDSPHSNLELLDTGISVDESFKYYILYKSAKPNSTWVPLARAEWFWKAEAVRQGQRWKLKSSPAPEGKLSKVENPTTEFPSYGDNTINKGWFGD